MTRSIQRTKVFRNTTAAGDKQDKRRANRRLRQRAHQAVNRGSDVMPLLREVSDVWDFAGDGKHYWRAARPEDMRK